MQRYLLKKFISETRGLVLVQKTVSEEQGSGHTVLDISANSHATNEGMENL
jgi:hypothetical protein